MAKCENGICHLCGNYGKMSYEHIPPQATNNKMPRKMVSLEETIKKLDKIDDFSSMKGLHYKQFQNGIGFFNLCKNCNEKLGALYVREYVRIVNGVNNELVKIDKDKRKGYLEIKLEGVNINAFFKQVISMFCTINTPEFGRKFKEYLLEPTNKNYDIDKYKIFMYVHNGTMDRICPFQVLIRIDSSRMTICSELSMFPLSFLMYDMEYSREPDLYGVDITEWAVTDYGKAYTSRVSVPFLTCNQGMILTFDPVI